MALDLRKSKFATKIIGVDASEANATQALRLGLVDEIDTLEGAVSRTDMVIIAIPVNFIPETLSKVLDVVSDQTTVIDVGSAKKQIADSVENHPKRRNYVAAHPCRGLKIRGRKQHWKDFLKERSPSYAIRKNQGRCTWPLPKKCSSRWE
jgi:prephenate dehydrogenase